MSHPPKTWGGGLSAQDAVQFKRKDAETPPLPASGGMQFIQFPTQGIAGDVLLDLLERALVADHVVVVATLPDGIPRGAAQLVEPASGDRLEVLDDGTERIRLGALRSAPL